MVVNGWRLYRIGLSWYVKSGEKASYRDRHVALTAAEAEQWAKTHHRSVGG
jgi:hypothetical protein